MACFRFELGHLSQPLLNCSRGPYNSQFEIIVNKSSRLSKEIREGIYKYGLVYYPINDKVFVRAL